MMEQVYKFTEEHRRNLSEAHKGKKQSLFTRTKRSQLLKGRKRPPFSDEWKKNIGLARKNTKHTEETRRKLSEMNRGDKTNFWKGGISKHYKTLDLSFFMAANFFDFPIRLSIIRPLATVLFFTSSFIIIC